MSKILLCCDLDRTLLPNGVQPESPSARPLLRKLAQHPGLTLVYVSGRHKALLQDAIEQYHIPVPDYAIGDVGTTIYTLVQGQWQPSVAWQQEIAPAWHGRTQPELATLFEDLPGLTLQEAEKQNRFKLSYYTPMDFDQHQLIDTMQARLQECEVKASLIWSVDEAKHCGLLDVLPQEATKSHAIYFLIEQLGLTEADAVFAGDSGNDLTALTSGLKAILVGNAAVEVKEEAQQGVAAAGYPQRLYLAKGGFMGMNGNYAAGVLEGLVHFFPQSAAWLGATES
jgi:HAD superfamily hydrolase (TIGR01484 family)